MTDLFVCVNETRRLCRFAEAPAHIMEGVGAHFCTGGRHDEHHHEGSLPIVLAGVRLHSTITTEIRSLLIPTLAAVHGKLIGGGVALALATNWRVCPRDTTFNFGNLPRGVNPILMFSRALPLLVGRRAAFQIYIEDAAISSEMLLESGLVSKVVESTLEAKESVR